MREMSGSIDSTTAQEASLDVISRAIHMGILSFGIAAWATGGLAEDYKNLNHPGFTVHSWLGVGLVLFYCLRLIYGIAGPASVRFSRWVPVSRDRRELVWEDLRSFLKFRIPDRPLHQGVAGLVQAFGLIVFGLMALTGGLMFFYLQPGEKIRGALAVIKEIHELGEGLIPVFWVLHVGAVLIHALLGTHLWRKMFFLERN